METFVIGILVLLVIEIIANLVIIALNDKGFATVIKNSDMVISIIICLTLLVWGLLVI